MSQIVELDLAKDIVLTSLGMLDLLRMPKQRVRMSTYMPLRELHSLLFNLLSLNL